jgi:hypothetical protein
VRASKDDSQIADESGRSSFEARTNVFAVDDCLSAHHSCAHLRMTDNRRVKPGDDEEDLEMPCIIAI